VCRGPDVAIYLRGVYCDLIPRRIPVCLKHPRPLRPPMRIVVAEELRNRKMFVVWEHPNKSVYRNIIEWCQKWKRQHRN
jgi:hypothetical protein